MYGKKYTNTSSNASSASDYFMEGKSKKSADGINTIFDTPEFVIDVYLGAMNGGSPKDGNFRGLSDRYCANQAFGNYNCNHNDDGSPCPCDAPKQGACCGADGEDPYEKGENHYAEEKKDCVSCCVGDSDSPYEGGQTFHEEGMKDSACDCAKDGSPYENGEKNDVKPVTSVAAKPNRPCAAEMDIAQKYPLECSNTEVYAEGENCSLCLKE